MWKMALAVTLILIGLIGLGLLGAIENQTWI